MRLWCSILYCWILSNVVSEVVLIILWIQYLDDTVPLSGGDWSGDAGGSCCAVRCPQARQALQQGQGEWLFCLFIASIWCFNVSLSLIFLIKNAFTIYFLNNNSISLRFSFFCLAIIVWYIYNLLFISDRSCSQSLRRGVRLQVLFHLVPRPLRPPHTSRREGQAVRPEADQGEDEFRVDCYPARLAHFGTLFLPWKIWVSLILYGRNSNLPRMFRKKTICSTMYALHEL